MSNNRILFVTSRNILTTSGELRLIKNRAEALFRHYNISTDFLVWQNNIRINSTNKENISAGGMLYCIRFSTLHICHSYHDLKKQLSALLSSGNYTTVILSGFAMSILTKYVQLKFQKKVGIDIHGASEDVIELTRDSSLISKLKSRLIFTIDYFLLKRNVKKADYCFVVTKELRDYVQQRFHTTNRTSFIIAPCATDGQSFDKETYIKNRKEYREKYGLDDQTPVFVYSGGVSKWQCIEETLQLYNQISQHIPNSRLLVFSHRVDYIKTFTNQSDIIFDSYSPNELEKALCAADYAFLLRKDCVTNNVAFPNKYLEYVKSGLYIISTPYLREIADQIKKYKIGYLYDMNNNIDNLVKNINSTEHQVEPNTINQVLDLNGFERTLIPLKDGF